MILQLWLKYRYHERGLLSQVNPDFDCCQIISVLRQFSHINNIIQENLFCVFVCVLPWPFETWYHLKGSFISYNFFQNYYIISAKNINKCFEKSCNLRFYPIRKEVKKIETKNYNILMNLIENSKSGATFQKMNNIHWFFTIIYNKTKGDTKMKQSEIEKLKKLIDVGKDAQEICKSLKISMATLRRKHSEKGLSPTNCWRVTR